MEKEDDLVSYKPNAATTQRLNAGKTEHKGIEIALGIKPIKRSGLMLLILMQSIHMMNLQGLADR